MLSCRVFCIPGVVDGMLSGWNVVEERCCIMAMFEDRHKHLVPYFQEFLRHNENSKLGIALVVSRDIKNI